MIFENVCDIVLDVEMDNELIIDSISRNNPTIPLNIDYLEDSSVIQYEWIIDLMQGIISFKSIGLIIFEREKETIDKKQFLTNDQRGDISFSQTGKVYYIK